MLQKIYPRTIRPNADGRFSAPYVHHPRYCSKPMLYLRAARVIAKDLDRLFDFVEPSDANLKTYSFEILGLFTRVCFEVEANLRGILLENRFRPNGKVLEANQLNMNLYRKVEQSHFLSKYSVLFPHWSDGMRDFQPFVAWGKQGDGAPDWYKAYNRVKHNRQLSFHEANLENLCLSFAALIVLLSSQFWREDGAATFVLGIGQSASLDQYHSSLVDGYHFKFDHEFDESERYEFVTPNEFSPDYFPYT